MSTFKLIVSSPDGNKFSGEVVKFDLRGVEGELAIMAGHIPFVTSAVKCLCKITMPDESEIQAECDGGLLTVDAEKTTFISGSFNILE